MWNLFSTKKAYDVIKAGVGDANLDPDGKNLLDLLWYWISGDRAADRQLANQMSLNEQTAALDYEYAKKSAEELPLLNIQGYKTAGFSSAAAAAALAGGSGVTSPTFSSAGSSEIAQPNLLNGIMDFLNTSVQKKLVDAQANNLDKDTEIKDKRYGLDAKFTEHQIKRDIVQLQQNAFKLGLDKRQLRLTERLINSQVGLMRSEVDKNFAEIGRIASEVEKNLSTVELQNTQRLHELLKMDNTQLDTILKGSMADYYRQETSTSMSQEALNYQSAYESETRQDMMRSQTQGQDLQNEDQRLALFVRQKRLEISDLLGFEIDAPEVTQCLEAIVDGDFSAISKALQTVSSGSEGWISRTARSGFTEVDYNRGSANPYRGNRVRWYPGTH